MNPAKDMQEETGTTEGETAGWDHPLDGRVSELRELVMDSHDHWKNHSLD